MDMGVVDPTADAFACYRRPMLEPNCSFRANAERNEDVTDQPNGVTVRSAHPMFETDDPTARNDEEPIGEDRPKGRRNDAVGRLEEKLIIAGTYTGIGREETRKSTVVAGHLGFGDCVPHSTPPSVLIGAQNSARSASKRGGDHHRGQCGARLTLSLAT